MDAYDWEINAGSNTVTLTWSGTGSTYSGAAFGEWSGVNAFKDYAARRSTGNYYGNSAEASNSNSRTSAKHDGFELAIGYAGDASFNSWASKITGRYDPTAANVQIGLEDQIAYRMERTRKTSRWGHQMSGPQELQFFIRPTRHSLCRATIMTTESPRRPRPMW